MKRTVFAVFLLAFAVGIPAQTLPFPDIEAGKIHLPFALEWFMPKDEAINRIASYGAYLGLPECDDQTCRWKASLKEGTAFVKLGFHAGTLVDFKLDAILMRDESAPYRERLDRLNEAAQDENMIFVDRKFFPPSLSTTPYDEYSTEAKDTLLKVKWREGEHSFFIEIEIAAK